MIAISGKKTWCLTIVSRGGIIQDDDIADEYEAYDDSTEDEDWATI